MATSSIPAAAYYRMSTDKQEASIPEQKAWVAQAAPQNGVIVVKEFQDDGITGSEIGRRGGLMDLITYAESHPGEVEAVIVWDADRFSRANSIKTAAILDRLMEAGISRILTAEGWIDFHNDVDRVLYHFRQDLTRAA